MDWDEARLVPSALIIGFDGVAAALLALVAVDAELSVAPLLITLAVGLLLAARILSPTRRWTLRVAASAAVIGSPAWPLLLATSDQAGDIGLAVTCLGIAASSLWVSLFLRGELSGEPPDLVEDRSGTPNDELAEWIEEIPSTLDWSELEASRSLAARARAT